MRFIKVNEETFINFDQVVEVSKGAKGRAVLGTVSGGRITLDITFDSVAIMLREATADQSSLEQSVATVAHSATFPTP